jgi:hypothetical protein
MMGVDETEVRWTELFALKWYFNIPDWESYSDEWPKIRK